MERLAATRKNVSNKASMAFRTGCICFFFSFTFFIFGLFFMWTYFSPSSFSRLSGNTVFGLIFGSFFSLIGLLGLLGLILTLTIRRRN
jgi:hypothetical protein